MNITPPDYPLWLQKDMAIAQELLPQLNIRVFFADDLPHTQEVLDYSMNKAICDANGVKPQSLLNLIRARVKHLQKISEFPGGYAKFKRQKLVIAALGMSGIVLSNAKHTAKEEHALPCFSQYYMDKQPTHAVIQLPPRGWSTQDNLSRSINLWHCHGENLPSFNFQRAVFWHEIGHLDDYSYPFSRLSTPKDNERSADHFAFMQLSQGDQPEQADAFMAWRKVSNFLTGYSPKCANYWNYLNKPPSAKITYTEIAAMAEVKLRALGELKYAPQSISLPRDMEVAAEWLAKLPDDSPFHIFNRFASRNCSAPHIMLSALAQAIERNEFTFPTSRLLAKDTIAAARFLLPDVFNDTTVKHQLRPQESPCLIRQPRPSSKWFPSLHLPSLGAAAYEGF